MAKKEKHKESEKTDVPHNDWESRCLMDKEVLKIRGKKAKNPTKMSSRHINRWYMEK